MRPVYRGTIHALSEEYQFFRKALVERLGEYCSFCEVPLGASLAVEHILSKATNPEHETNWDNFILACTNCNSIKGKQVSHTNWNAYYFPTDTRIPRLFDKFTYYLDTDGYVKVKQAATTDLRAKETIDLTKLNRTDADADKVSDRRVANRTETWHAAVVLADRLATYYRGPAAPNDLGVNMLKEQIKDAAIARGFWSVWMTVFRARTFLNDAILQDLLYELFVETFPGTNYPLGSHPDSPVEDGYNGGLPGINN
jgi:uncharacterized protein (TIGR02646 family)